MLLKTDSIIGITVSWKLDANEELNRTWAVLRNAIDQKFNTNSSKIRFLLLQANKILGIAFAKIDLSKETKSDHKKRYFTNFRSSRSEVFCKIGVIKISQNSQENICAGVS